jgi:hypothetical protein
VPHSTGIDTAALNFDLIADVTGQPVQRLGR